MVKGVDMCLRKMALKVCDLEGDEVLLYDYIDESLEDHNGGNKRISKGKREVRNLVWEMKGGESEYLERAKRQGRGKNIVK